MKQRALTRTDGALLLAVILGLAGIVYLSYSLEASAAPEDSTVTDEALYLNPATVKRLSLGFNGVAADVYWMRSLQYVGNKILSLKQDAAVNNLGQLNLKLLAPLLDTATTLDPQFMAPYEYAASILPEVDVEAAIRIIKKGINANPTSWRLYHHLGYIHWQQKDFPLASEAYGHGSQLPGAPAWMASMRARTLTEGGSRKTAREIYLRMFEEATEDLVKEMARSRLMELDSLDQQDALRSMLSAYRTNNGRCPQSWREVQNVLRLARMPVDSSGAPLDPGGAPYRLLDNCEVALDPTSKMPLR